MTELYIRRKADHKCVQCGNGDDRTERGLVLCEVCWNAAQSNLRLRRASMKKRNMCVGCGQKDENTLVGKAYCKACIARQVACNRKRRERRRKLNVQQG